MNVIECNHERHSRAILDILNDAILNSTALYDYKTRSPESMLTWFNQKELGGFPVLGVEGADGTLMGFASYGSFRAWPAYKYSVEHSVYVHKHHRGKKVGTALMEHLIERAAHQNYHVMIAGIDVDNPSSVALHAALGFKHVGTIAQVGFKFGRWLDLAFYQLVLPTPIEPMDG